MESALPKSTLKLLLLADCHGDATQVKIIGETLHRWSFEPDATILAGDIGGTVHPALLFSYIIHHRNLNRSSYAHWVFKGNGRPLFAAYQISSALSVVKTLNEINRRVYAVLGNSDLETVANVLSEHQEISCVLIDRNKDTIDGYQIIGASGALAYLGKAPICDNEYSPRAFAQAIAHLKERISQLQSQNFLLVTHEAPWFKHETLKLGSKGIMNLIREFQPIVAIFGHHHQAPGIFRIGQTLTINPGPAVAGHFGLLKLSFEEKRSNIRVCLFKLPINGRSFARVIYSARDWALRRQNIHSSPK